MILKTPSSPAIERGTIGNTMVSIGGGGQQVGSVPTTNRIIGRANQPTSNFQKNPAFAEYDGLINHLDALYNHLSDQTPWENYANYLAGHWALCANCSNSEDAQRLFRQYNYWRTVTFQAIANTPVDPTEQCSSNNIFCVITSFGGGIYAAGFGAGPAIGQKMCMQVGGLLKNPILEIDGSPTGTTYYNDTTANYAFVANMTVGDPYPYCWFTQNGTPGNKGILYRLF